MHTDTNRKQHISANLVVLEKVQILSASIEETHVENKLFYVLKIV